MNAQYRSRIRSLIGVLAAIGACLVVALTAWASETSVIDKTVGMAWRFDYDEGAGDWEGDEYAAVGRDSQYRLDGIGKGSDVVVLNGSESWDDYAVTATLTAERLLRDGIVGIRARVQGDSYYEFQITRGRTMADISAVIVKSRSASEDSPIELGRFELDLTTADLTNVNLTAVVKGDRLSLCLDNALLLTVVDDELREGMIAMCVNEKAVARFASIETSPTTFWVDFSDIVKGATTYTTSSNCAFDIDDYDGQLGLIQSGSKVLLFGKEFRAMGMNIYDGFIDMIETGRLDDMTIVQHFRTIRENDIPYVRLNFSQFWPVTYRRYEADKASYYYVMDRVVRAAEEVGIGLIPCLFWHQIGTSDYCDEPFNSWGDPSSKTRAFMQQYVKEVVDRYKDSPSIFAWEFTNEMNLYCDLPYAASAMANTINLAMGTRSSRTKDDYMTTDIMVDAMNAFAAEVRKYDQDRIITSGNGFTREAAYNWYTSKGANWPDTMEEFKRILEIQNPADLALVSIHVYYDQPARGADQLRTAYGYTTEVKKHCDEIGRPLFVGEYAGDVTEWDHEVVRQQFYNVFTAIRDNEIPLSAVWSGWCNERHYEKNILANPDLYYIVKEIGDYNRAVFEELDIDLWK